MIPKIIHYCWYGGRRRLSRLNRKCMDSWKKYCPDWKIKEWNENNSPMDTAFARRVYSNKKYSSLSDLTRMYALYNEGGIYLDTDVEIIKNLDIFLTEECFFGVQCHFHQKEFINGAILGATINHPFIKELMEELLNNFDETEESNLHGPRLITKMLEKKGLNQEMVFSNQKFIIDGITIFPKNYFYPYSWLEKFNYSCIKEETHAIHHWAISWLPKVSLLERFKNYLKKIFYLH